LSGAAAAAGGGRRRRASERASTRPSSALSSALLARVRPATSSQFANLLTSCKARLYPELRRHRLDALTRNHEAAFSAKARLCSLRGDAASSAASAAASEMAGILEAAERNMRVEIRDMRELFLSQQWAFLQTKEELEERKARLRDAFTATLKIFSTGVPEGASDRILLVQLSRLNNYLHTSGTSRG